MIYAVSDNNFLEPLDSIEKRVKIVLPNIKIIKRLKKLKTLFVDLNETLEALLLIKKTGLVINKKDDSKGVYKEF